MRRAIERVAMHHRRSSRRPAAAAAPAAEASSSPANGSADLMGRFGFQTQQEPQPSPRAARTHGAGLSVSSRRGEAATAHQQPRSTRRPEKVHSERPPASLAAAPSAEMSSWPAGGARKRVKKETVASSAAYALAKRKGSGPQDGGAEHVVFSIPAVDDGGGRLSPADATGEGGDVPAPSPPPTAAVVPPPADFRDVYGIIGELRHPDGPDSPMRGAPVDEIGCSQAADAVYRAQGEERNFHVSVYVRPTSSATRGARTTHMPSPRVRCGACEFC
jgi:hypothetical protein